MTPRGYVPTMRSHPVEVLGRIRGELAISRTLAAVATDPRSCWIWPVVRSIGYGRAYGTRQAHRVVYERLVGPIPAGLQLDHLCRTPACVNPWHLEPVTAAENQRRGKRAQQTHCGRGHEFTAENTRIRGNGTRQCKTCSREGQARRRGDR